METNDFTSDATKKCFCARCFLPIDADDRIDIEGQNFHRICSMCCICRNVPKSLKTFYGHVFCTDCFKAHVLSRFRGEQKFQSNSWWTPMTGEKRKGKKQSEREDKAESGTKSGDAVPVVPKELKDSLKKQICARCLETIPQDKQVTIGGQAFHQPCARCYCCHTVPTSSVKIYYGQVFCEECFSQYVINRDKDNPTEFFKSCFDSWNTNPQFSEHMRDFMSSGKSAASPVVFMMQGSQPYCRCSGSETQPPQPKKCKTVAPGEPCQGAAKVPAAGRPAGPLREGLLWQDTGPPRHNSATLQNVLPHSPLCRDSRNEVHSVSPPRVGRPQWEYRNMDINSVKEIKPIRFDDVAQRFMTTVLGHGQISPPDVSQHDSESRDSASRDDSRTLDNASLQSLKSEGPQRNEKDSLYFYNGALQQVAGLLKHDNGMPKRGNGITKRGNGMPKRDNGMLNRENFRISVSPDRRRSRFHKDSLGRDSASLKSYNGSSQNENGSLKSDSGSLAREIESLQQDDGSARHLPVSAESSMIPLFQSSLESCRPTYPRRRFIRNHEKKMFAAASVQNAEELDGWDLLSLHTNTTGTETEDRSSIGNESANFDEIVDVAEREKIEKLTQYLHRASQENRHKNWKMFYNSAKANVEVSERGDEPGWGKVEPLVSGWVDIQLRRNKGVFDCPKCLWQSGIFTPNSGWLSKLLVSGGGSFFE